MTEKTKREWHRFCSRAIKQFLHLCLESGLDPASFTPKVDRIKGTNKYRLVFVEKI